MSDQSTKVVKASIGWVVDRAATLAGRGTQKPDELAFIELAEWYKAKALPADREGEFAKLCSAQKAAERKEREQAWVTSKLIEIQKRRSKTEADQLFVALAKNTKRSADEQRQFQVLIDRERSREAFEKKDRIAVQSVNAKRDAERRQRTKNLCDAGGLMVKAGFLKEGTGEFAYTREVIYGMLLDAMQRRGSYQQQWADKGRQAFEAEAAAAAAGRESATTGTQTTTSTADGAQRPQTAPAAGVSGEADQAAQRPPQAPATTPPELIEHHDRHQTGIGSDLCHPTPRGNLASNRASPGGS